ncbi:MAG: DUF4268 domain-containing protein, partial [Acidobacteriota bacterium]
DGETPPEHEPLHEPEDDEAPSVSTGERGAARKRFWEALVAHAKERGTMHAECRPGTRAWIGRRRQGQLWNYVVYAHTLRVELYLDRDPKAVFDCLRADAEAIEAELGFDLEWQRLDHRHASRLALTLPRGGWADEGAWAAVVEEAVGVMETLRRVLGQRLDG